MALTWRAAALVLLGLFPVAQWPSMTTVRWWVLGCLLVFLADLLLAPKPSSLSLDRSADTQVRLGEPASTTLRVGNPGRRRVRGRMRDAWVPSAGARGDPHTVDIPGGERRRFTTDLLPTRRGDRRTDAVTLRLTGPLGIAARQQSFRVPGSVRVLPPFHSRKHLPSRLAQLRQIDGRSAVRTRGQGTEFDSLRDYVEGDDVRSIDWRATARRQHVVVRTWQPERDRRVILVLDTSRTSAARIEDQPRLDAAMDSALLLAALASRAGDRIDLIAGDRQIRGRVTPNTDRTALLHQLVTVMAPIEPVLVEADWTMLAGRVTALTRRRALVVLLTALEPAAVEEGLLPVLPALTAHHRVVLASVADPELGRMREDLSDLEHVYDAAAAERTISLRRRTGDALERMGVHVLEADPEALPPMLADHYLALKAQGLL
ncbi:DUF58 domain-containing protein [Ornithinicoccus hortensis]|uniref:Uncharacterized protein (DUF58 family) n=1 Tax=Ornithinicoccus hortensis TaxID=82346 RepID=A0A542YQR9_9MICO|nr:DUF58 domain-containing protein [Ornithinicoccus hortensis]TQL50264.1 uncharacterized protein (DUF58 family) [Ornithinicoccus hortensis]